MSACSEESAVSVGHRILEDGAQSFLLKQRTQNQLSEVARWSWPSSHISPQQSLQTHSMRSWVYSWSLSHTEKWGPNSLRTPHRLLSAAFPGSSGESSSGWEWGCCLIATVHRWFLELPKPLKSVLFITQGGLEQNKTAKDLLWCDKCWDKGEGMELKADVLAPATVPSLILNFLEPSFSAQ